MIDTLLSEYKWSLDYVLFDLPLMQAFALYAAICARYEVTPTGPTYAEQELIAEHFPAASCRRKQKRKKGRARRPRQATLSDSGGKIKI